MNSTKIKQLIQDTSKTKIKHQETKDKSVITGLPISILKTTTLILIIPSFIPPTILAKFVAISFLIGLVFFLLIKGKRKRNNERILNYYSDLTNTIDDLAKRDEAENLLKPIIINSYLDYMEASKIIIEFKWEFRQNLSFILGNLLLITIQYLNPNLKPTWFWLCMLLVFGFNWYFIFHFTQKKITSEKEEFYKKVNEQYQELL